MIWRRRKPTQRPRPQVIFCPYCCTLQPIPTTAAERSSAPQREETTMPSYEGESPAMKVGFPVRDSIDEATLTRLFRMSQMPQTELEDELDSGSIAGVRHLLNEVVDTRAEYRHRIDELNKLENNIRNHVAESAQAASTKDLGGIAGPGSDAYAKAARG